MPDLAESQERYQEALDASRSQRDQIEEDLAFSDPSDPQQWTDQELRERRSDPGGARSCLVHDQTEQYVANVAGQVEQRPPALHAIPVGGGADRKVAERLDGLYRHIEHASRAQQHYAIAMTSAARAGVGYLLARPEYVDRALGWQEPRIASEGDPMRIVFDPFSKELDGSDAAVGWHQIPMSCKEFERRFGKDAGRVDFGDLDGRVVDEREAVLVCEQWWKTEERKNVVVYLDEKGHEASDVVEERDWHEAVQHSGLPLQFLRSYKEKVQVVKWQLMSGADILEESDYPADGIGIVPVYGYVSWVNGRLRYCGIPRRARDPQRAYNWHTSEIRDHIANAPKAPWIMPLSGLQFAGIKDQWDRASTESRAYLAYQDYHEGRQVAPPQRAPVAVNLQNLIVGAQQAKADIQAALGMYQANLGAPSNETSGVAIESRKQQGEAATAHFPSHLAASLGQVGSLILQMIPRLIDKRRQVRIIGIDGTSSSVVIDPEQGQAMQEAPEGVIINPNVGKYDVRTVIGASFSTQRQQAQEAYTEMMRANPAMMPAIAPLWAQVLDVPHADKLAQVLTAMAPDPVKAILQPEQGESTAQLMAERDQLKQALQEAIKTAQEAMQEAQDANAKLDAKEDENAIKAFDAVTKRAQAVAASLTPEQVQTIAMQTFMQLMQQPNPMEGPGEAGEDPMAADQPPSPLPLSPMSGGANPPFEPEQPQGML